MWEGVTDVVVQFGAVVLVSGQATVFFTQNKLARLFSNRRRLSVLIRIVHAQRTIITHFYEQIY